MLQRNVPEEVRERERREVMYREKKSIVKRLVKESKESLDEDFGRKLSVKYQGNKKLFLERITEK